MVSKKLLEDNNIDINIVHRLNIVASTILMPGEYLPE